MKTRGPERGFSLVELMVAMLLIGILTAYAVPQLVTAYDRSRQRTTIADMRSIAVANGTYRVDLAEYAPDLDALEPLFMRPVPRNDAWGIPWTYDGRPDDYSLSSTGSDGAAGPAPPANWYDEPFEADIVIANGAFTQAPRAQ